MKVLFFVGGLLIFMSLFGFIGFGIVYAMTAYQQQQLRDGSRISTLGTRVGKQNVETSEGTSTVDVIRYTTRRGQTITTTTGTVCDASFGTSKTLPVIYDPEKPMIFEEECTPAISVISATIGIILLVPGIILLVYARLKIRAAVKYAVPYRQSNRRDEPLTDREFSRLD